jgi:hypothetical protein
METPIMNGNHSQYVFDLAKLNRDESMRVANRQRLVNEAKSGRTRSAGIVAGTRRVFGGAIISLGQAVRGERLEAADAAQVSTTTLRMAR